MEANGKYYIYDWELGVWVERDRESYEKYKKVLAEMHNIMFPKDNKIGKVMVFGTGDPQSEDFEKLFINPNNEEDGKV